MHKKNINLTDGKRKRKKSLFINALWDIETKDSFRIALINLEFVRIINPIKISDVSIIWNSCKHFKLAWVSWYIIWLLLDSLGIILETVKSISFCSNWLEHILLCSYNFSAVRQRFVNLSICSTGPSAWQSFVDVLLLIKAQRYHRRCCHWQLIWKLI